MREAEIRAMHQANANRSMLLLRQFDLLKARQDALDTVVRESTFAQRVGWVFSAKRFTKLVDHLELKVLQEGQRALLAAAEAKKNKPTIHRVV